LTEEQHPPFSPSFAEHPLLWDGAIEQRLYQKNIADAARHKNTLVILPTALGKTMIAALVCADMLYKYRDKRVLMMAPTRPLVSQHLKSFSAVLKIMEEQVAMVTGKTVPEARRAVWDKRDVRLVFATPEVVRNDLEEGRLNLKDFILLVFDEAHRAVKDYAYTTIAREYVGQSMHPVILAMTASPGAKRERVQEVCNNLYIEHVEYRSEEDCDVKPYVNPIEVKWEWFDLPEEYRYIASVLRSMLDERLKWLVQRGLLGKKKDTRWIFKRDLIEAGEALRYRLELTMEEQRGPIYVAIMNQSAALTLMYCLELIESQGSHSLKAFFERIEEEGGRAHAALLKDPKVMEIRALVEKAPVEHPKIRRIVELVNDAHSGAKNHGRVLVFTQYRDTARHIVEVLSSNGIKASRFVGQAKRQGDEGMKQDEQAAVLESFRNGEFDVLVATSIAEEGLDIPEVDLVVFYEPIPSEIRYIQRRGRTGRKAAGSVVILAANDTIDTRHLYASKRRVEKMKESLSSINAVLSPVKRAFLEPNPMTAEDLAALEGWRSRVEERLRKEVAEEIVKKGGGPVEAAALDAEVRSRVQQLRRKAISAEEEVLTGAFQREVERAARRIHTELAKAGVKGADVELLREYLSLDYPVLNEALKKLEKLRRLAWRDEGTVVLADNLAPAKGDIYSLRVEKVMQGRAVVMVNKKWHARLNHYDYSGPRELLKKGATFDVIGELYRQDGVLSLKVKQIVSESGR
jgi:ERCC4-related helicase